jgi:hypothetical protein
MSVVQLGISQVMIASYYYRLVLVCVGIKIEHYMHAKDAGTARCQSTKSTPSLSLFSNYLARPLIHANNAQMTSKRRMATEDSQAVYPLAQFGNMRERPGRRRILTQIDIRVCSLSYYALVLSASSVLISIVPTRPGSTHTRHISR